MRSSFALTLARREARAGFRKLGIHIGSIAIGVAALVAIHSFRADVSSSIERESRSILGADLRLSARAPLNDSVMSVVDSLVRQGAAAARVIDVPSMVLAERSQVARLMQLRAVEPGFPYYGAVETEPAELWPPDVQSGSVLVDEPVLIQLNAEIGDTVLLGQARFRIAGTVSGLPTDIGIQAAVGPRVYLPFDALDRTGLLGFGSLASHQAFVRLPEGIDADVVDEAYRDRWRATSTRTTTAREQAEDLTEGIQILTRFLGLVGLSALLLGGIGVASAIHVYVKEKLVSVAVLRCIGATQADVFRAYLFQAGFLGFVGSVLGVVLGVLIQQFLPQVVGGLLPVTITTSLNFPAILAGLGLGVWVSMIFALGPMLAVRDVSPLKALRHNYEAEKPRIQPARVLATAALLGSLVLLCVLEAPTWWLGLGFAAGLDVTLALLWFG
ncbi:MAG: putative ABC transport system permease protein [Myxococcota bacterium]|jgi:putative ABC transport system permease protein